MRVSRENTVETTRPENYLPAMPPLSITPGRVERFLTTLLRRRGGLRRVTRRDYR